MGCGDARARGLLALGLSFLAMCTVWTIMAPKWSSTSAGKLGQVSWRRMRRAALPDHIRQRNAPPIDGRASERFARQLRPRHSAQMSCLLQVNFLIRRFQPNTWWFGFSALNRDPPNPGGLLERTRSFKERTDSVGLGGWTGCRLVVTSLNRCS